MNKIIRGGCYLIYKFSFLIQEKTPYAILNAVKRNEESYAVCSFFCLRFFANAQNDVVMAFILKK